MNNFVLGSKIKGSEFVRDKTPTKHRDIFRYKKCNASARVPTHDHMIFLPHLCKKIKIFLLLNCRSERRVSASSAASRMLFAVSSVFLLSTGFSTAFSALLANLNENSNTAARQILREILTVTYPLPLLLISCGNFPVLLLTMEVFRTNLKKILGLEN